MLHKIVISECQIITYQSSNVWIIQKFSLNISIHGIYISKRSQVLNDSVYIVNCTGVIMINYPKCFKCLYSNKIICNQ